MRKRAATVPCARERMLSMGCLSIIVPLYSWASGKVILGVFRFKGYLPQEVSEVAWALTIESILCGAEKACKPCKVVGSSQLVKLCCFPVELYIAVFLRLGICKV